MQRAYLRNAVPVPGPYKVGDIVSYCRRPRLGETGIQWSVGSRIVGFETDPKNPDKDPSTAWVVCDGLPVCVAIDKIRPCTAAELLAYQFMNGKDLANAPVIESAEQQMFVDERILPSKELRAEDSTLPAVNAEDRMTDADFDVMMSPSAAAASTTQVSDARASTDDYSAEELRASGSASTAREHPGEKRKVPSNEGLSEHWKRTNVTGKGVQLLDSMSYLSDCDDKTEGERVGFLQIRLMPPKVKKTPIRKPPKK